MENVSKSTMPQKKTGDGKVMRSFEKKEQIYSFMYERRVVDGESCAGAAAVEIGLLHLNV